MRLYNDVYGIVKLSAGINHDFCVQATKPLQPGSLADGPDAMMDILNVHHMKTDVFNVFTAKYHFSY